MLAHASRNPSSGSRCVRHVPAVANVSPATGLIWPRVVGAKNRAILFGYERLFVTAHPVGQCLAFAHVRIEGVCSGFTNDWDDDRSDSRGVPGCGFSNMHALRLEIRGICPQWIRMRRTHPEHISSALPPIADVRESWSHFPFVPLAAVSNRSRAAPLFDDLVGGCEQGWRNDKAEHPGGPGVDDQLELRCLHNRQIRGLGAPEDAAGIDACLTERIPDV